MKRGRNEDPLSQVLFNAGPVELFPLPPSTPVLRQRLLSRRELLLGVPNLFLHGRVAGAGSSEFCSKEQSERVLEKAWGRSGKRTWSICVLSGARRVDYSRLNEELNERLFIRVEVRSPGVRDVLADVEDCLT
jgi:hypothetical protein